MTIWIDAHISPLIARWIESEYSIPTSSLQDLHLRDATDIEIFNAARTANAIIVTKDSDFIDLINRLGTPPQMIWITCGNTSNEHLQSILKRSLTTVLKHIHNGEAIVELRD